MGDGELCLSFLKSGIEDIWPECKEHTGLPTNLVCADHHSIICQCCWGRSHATCDVKEITVASPTSPRIKFPDKDINSNKEDDPYCKGELEVTEHGRKIAQTVFEDDICSDKQCDKTAGVMATDKHIDHTNGDFTEPEYIGLTKDNSCSGSESPECADCDHSSFEDLALLSAERDELESLINKCEAYKNKCQQVVNKTGNSAKPGMAALSLHVQIIDDATALSWLVLKSAHVLPDGAESIRKQTQLLRTILLHKNCVKMSDESADDVKLYIGVAILVLSVIYMIIFT